MQNASPLRIFFPISENFQLSQTSTELFIEKKWFQPVFKYLKIFLSIFQIVLLLVWASLVYTHSSLVFLWALTGIMQLLVVLLAYYTIAGYLNTRMISVTNNIFTLTDRPVKWYKNLHLATREIKEFILLRINNGSEEQTTYDLILQKKDQKEIKILTDILGFEPASLLLEKLNRSIEP